MSNTLQQREIINDYNELKRKFDILLKENKALKARILELESKSEIIVSDHKIVKSSKTLFQEPKEPVKNPKSVAAVSAEDNINAVTRYSQNNEKIDLFMSLFKGRTDVYAKKWKSKKGTSGYSPFCLNEWVPGICNKPKTKCSACGNQSYGALKRPVVEMHLRGRHIIGIYPLNLDETCHFLAIDFDKEGWKKDITVRFSVDAKKQAEKRPFDHYLIPRFTSFRSPPDVEGKQLSLQEIKASLVSDEIRNQLIIDDVVECYEKGRKSLILTGRTGHVAELAEKLKVQISNVICLTGGMGNKKTAQVIGEINAIKDAKPFVLVATGSYIGEGFDEARLDTLFLAMPISWKGTLHQYAGRLHRQFKEKKDVRIYDYVDLHVKMLEKMYGKRLKGYASIGYKAKASKFPDAPTNIIFNKDDFFPVYLRDIAVASKHLLIVSPFVTKKRMLQMMDHFNDLLKKQVEITIITRPADDYDENRKAMLSNLFSAIDADGVQMVYKPSIHQKFAIIDNKITWYGSINFLSFYLSCYRYSPVQTIRE